MNRLPHSDRTLRAGCLLLAITATAYAETRSAEPGKKADSRAPSPVEGRGPGGRGEVPDLHRRGRLPVGLEVVRVHPAGQSDQGPRRLAAGRPRDDSAASTALDRVQLPPQVWADGDLGLGLHTDSLLGCVRQGGLVGQAVRGEKDPLRVEGQLPRSVRWVEVASVQVQKCKRAALILSHENNGWSGVPSASFQGRPV